jgi:LETM1 and EF-hand domain-containing protein 1
VQLVNMCKFVNIPAYGTDTFLRYQLRAALRNIKADDRLIATEGVSSLTYDELRAACRSRGMRWDGETTTSMRTQLEDWLELSLGAALPSSLLILSRAFTITHQRLEDPETAAVSDLEATLASLPDEVLKKVELEACANEDSAAQKLRRLESLRHEEEMIAEEAADRQDAATAAAAFAASSRDLALEEMSKPTTAAAALVAAAQQPLLPAAQAADAAALAAAASEPPAPVAAPAEVCLRVGLCLPFHSLSDLFTSDNQLSAHSHSLCLLRCQGAPLVDELSADELSAAVAAERRRLARRVAHALATLAGASPVASERAEFACLLRKEVDRYEDLLESGDAARVLSAHGPSRLSARLSSLLSGLERELDRVDASIGQKLHRLDLNADGRLDRAELAGVAGGLLRDALQGEDLRAVLGDAVFDADGNIKLADLIALAQEAQEDGGDEPAPTVRARARARDAWLRVVWCVHVFARL